MEYVAGLARRKEEIRAEARKMRINIKESDQLFESHLYSLNSLVDGLKHSPGEIPIAKQIESDDCRTLAELDQSNIGEKINTFFPFITSMYHHIGSVLNGYQTCGSAMQRILNRLKVGLTRKIVRGSSGF